MKIVKVESDEGRNEHKDDNEELRRGKVSHGVMADDEGESDGDDVANDALFALSLPWGTVSQLIPQALSMHS